MANGKGSVQRPQAISREEWNKRWMNCFGQEFVSLNAPGSNKALAYPVGYIKAPGCWEWVGSRVRGYGQLSVAGRQYVAHRYVYEQLRGPIPAGLTLDHLCRNRGCVNPDHLEPVTRGENVMRGVGHAPRNARKTHCSKGHPLSGDNLVASALRSHGWRLCRTCDNANEKQWRRVRKARRQ